MSEELWILFMTGSMVCFGALAVKSQRQSFLHILQQRCQLDRYQAKYCEHQSVDRA
jgi:hypothetical protein